MGKVGSIVLLNRGRYIARWGQGRHDLVAAHDLRHLAFLAADPDQGHFDARCQHVLILDHPTNTLVCCFRIMVFPNGALIAQSYSAQFYGLQALSTYDHPMIEVGRFCLHPDWHDPDILRLAWAAITRIVDATGAQLLFGCSSFAGTDPSPYANAFAMLNARHLAPAKWAPTLTSPESLRFTDAQPLQQLDQLTAPRNMPPLLRSYLGMGGWVGDHAVVDRNMGTLHVFTGLEIASIPPARAHALRLIAL